jgi:hypothetical protein
VEAIAQKSQNIKWVTTVDKNKVSHKYIRRVSLDQFYALVTGEDDAFYQMCMALPRVIENVVKNGEGIKIPHDTVFEELKIISEMFGTETKELSMAMAVYMLGFNTYKGFEHFLNVETENIGLDVKLNFLYDYAKKVAKNGVLED